MNFSAELLPLAAGTALAIVALMVVLGPLLSGKDTSDELSVVAPRRVANGDGTAVAALREIEFDKATGKLSDKDYDSLRAMYTRDALAELRAADAYAAGGVATPGAGATTDDLVEAAIRRAKTSQEDCGSCGAHPEPNAIYCSSCGHYLPGTCKSCGTRVDAAGARFCTGCGEGLAAA